MRITKKLTGILYVQKHGNKNVVNEVKRDAVGKDGVPQHEKILHGEFSAKEKAHPTTTNISY
jgi:hypothetical protein